MERTKVVLVDLTDEEIAVMDKMEAHIKGLLHRAFSVFIFNDKNELLLQQRAITKYHSPGLWTNTCCSHPQAGENVKQSAMNRLEDEMGFQTDLTKSFDFIYKADVGDGLTEHEFDHVFTGIFNEQPRINKNEVSAFKWMKLEDIVNDIVLNPALYTVWFKIIFDKYLNHLKVKG